MMKKSATIYFTLLVSLCSFANEKNNIQITPQNYLTDSIITNQILALPLQSYIGKPVDSLLSILPSSYSSRGLIPLAIGRKKGIYQVYGVTDTNNSVIEIYIDVFQYHPVPFYEPSANWNINLLKKETIAFIKVIKNDLTCVYGCYNPNYY